MQAQREFPASLNDVKDKFLVQYCPVGPEVKEVGADTFETSAAKDVRQTKLRVVLVRALAIVYECCPPATLISAPATCKKTARRLGYSEVCSVSF